MRRCAGFCLCAFGLLGCASPDRSAGGSSYETENAVAIRVVFPDGTPAAGALARARPSAWMDSAGSDAGIDLRADASGRIEIPLGAGAWRIELRADGLAAMADVVEGGRGDLGTVALAPTGRIAGRTVPGARVGCAGLGHGALAGSDGRFLIDSLPAGRHAIRAFGSTARAFATVGAGATIEAGILHADTAGRILVDDFEDGDSRAWYGAWTGRGWWWVAADSVVHLSPDGVSNLPSLAVIADGAGGKVLQFAADFPAGAPATTWAQCGVDFGPRVLDLSGLVSVRFRARGIGAVALLVNIDSASWDQVPRATVQLDTVWREYEIRASSLQLPASSGSVLDSAGRAARLRKAVGLTWSLSASGDLWLDDVRLVGPSPSLLWGASPPP